MKPLHFVCLCLCEHRKFAQSYFWSGLSGRSRHHWARQSQGLPPALQLLLHLGLGDGGRWRSAAFLHERRGRSSGWPDGRCGHGGHSSDDVAFLVSLHLHLLDLLVTPSTLGPRRALREVAHPGEVNGKNRRSVRGRHLFWMNWAYLARLSSRTSIPLEVNSASWVGSRTTSELEVVVTTDPASLEVSSILSFTAELIDVFLVSTVSSIMSPEPSSTRILNWNKVTGWQLKMG